MKIIFCALLMTITNYLYSQNTLVVYDVLCSGKVTTCDLFVNDTITVFNVKNPQNTTYKDEMFYLEKHEDNHAYFTDRFFNVVFYVKDTLHNIKWELNKDTMSILGEKCFSAKTSFRGRKYTAFYSAKYNLSEGPWKFGGLPGLILYVKSDDNYIEWKAVKLVENSTSKVEYPNIDKYKFLSWDEYVNKYISTIDKYIKIAKSSGAVKSDTESKIKVEATEIIYPKLQTGEGITF